MAGIGARERDGTSVITVTTTAPASQRGAGRGRERLAVARNDQCRAKAKHLGPGGTQQLAIRDQRRRPAGQRHGRPPGRRSHRTAGISLLPGTADGAVRIGVALEFPPADPGNAVALDGVAFTADLPTAPGQEPRLAVRIQGLRLPA